MIHINAKSHLKDTMMMRCSVARKEVERFIDQVMRERGRETCSKASHWRYRLWVAANIISRWRVVADHKSLSFVIFLHANTQLFGILPHYLSEMTCSSCSRLLSKHMLLNLFIPCVNCIPAVDNVTRIWAAMKFECIFIIINDRRALGCVGGGN